jgi:hypothetical protein
VLNDVKFDVVAVEATPKGLEFVDGGVGPLLKGLKPVETELAGCEVLAKGFEAGAIIDVV